MADTVTLLAVGGGPTAGLYRCGGEGLTPLGSSSYELSDGSFTSCVAWNHTNQVVAVGGPEDSKVHLIHHATCAVLSTFEVVSSNLRATSPGPVALSFSHNSRHLAVSCGGVSGFQLWDLKRRELKTVFTGHSSPVVSLNFNTVGDCWAGDLKGVIRLWTIRNAIPITSSQSSQVPFLHLPLTATTLTTASPLLELIDLNGCGVLRNTSLSPTGNLLAGAFSDGVRVWDTSPQKTAPHNMLLRHLNSNPQEETTSVSFSPKNPRLIAASTSAGTLQLLDTHRANVCATARCSVPLTATSFHDDGVHTAVGSANGSVFLFDWRNASKPIHTIDVYHNAPITCLAFQATRAKSESSADMSNTSVSRGDIPSTPTVINVTTAPSTAPSTVPFTTSKTIRQPTPPPSATPIQPEEYNTPMKTTHGASVPPSTYNVDHVARAFVSASRISTPNTNSQLDPTIQSVTDKKINSFSSGMRSRIQSTPHSLAMSSEAVMETPASHHSRHQSSEYISEIHTPVSMTEDDDDERIFDHRGGDNRPVTMEQLDDALQTLRLDIHREVQEVIHEQVRQFMLAREDTAKLLETVTLQLGDLLRANNELREENAKLRRIY